jgi:teichoic acid ribitol-phosphate primase
MNPLEYRLSSAVLRVFGRLFSLLPIRQDRVVLATPRKATLDGNLAHLLAAMRARHPDLDYVLLLEPYAYGLLAKVTYLFRLIRGMYHLRTSRLFIVDNAYLPIHVARHRPGTTVVQVWHALGALKRFGADTSEGLQEPERTFLHRHYDYVIAAGEATREPYAAAFRTPVDRVLSLGGPRSDFFFDETAMSAASAAVRRAYPALADRRVVLYAPTFRGRGKGKHPGPALDAARLRGVLPADHVLALKTHPNLDASMMPTDGYDVVIDPGVDINEVLAITDVFITDYSSSIFEFALLRRPIILLVPDLDAYERDPGFYLDFRQDMIGSQVTDTDGVVRVFAEGTFDVSGYDAFIERHLGACDGHSSDRFVDRFMG